MDGIGTVFGVIALFVALAALWFVSDVVKRLGRENQQFLETHLRPLKEAVDGAGGRIASLERKVAEAERQLDGSQKTANELGRALEEHEGRLEALRGDLERLDRSMAANRKTPPGGPRFD